MKTNWLCDKFWCRLIHLKIILWNKPLEIGLCNKAILIYIIKYIFEILYFRGIEFASVLILILLFA